MKELRDKNMSFSTTTLMGKSQGGDFVLEGKVKWQKLVSPKGSPKGSKLKHGLHCQERLTLLTRYTVTFLLN